MQGVGGGVREGLGGFAGFGCLDKRVEGGIVQFRITTSKSLLFGLKINVEKTFCN